MRNSGNMMSYTTAALGIVTAASMVATYAIFEILRPKMIQFESLTIGEENLINFFGIGLLLALVFYLLSLYQLVRYSAKAHSLSLLHLILIAGGVLSLLFIFGDVALLSDIGKQYQSGLSQPEWTVLYLVVAFQLATIVALTYAILATLRKDGQDSLVVRDSNTFLLAQYIGAICGLTGLTLMILNFFFPRPLWMMKAQVIPTTFVLLVPYALIMVYWFAIKLKEKTGEWIDEKQAQDIGFSSFLTLMLSVVVMTLLFFLNLDTLNGMLSVLWFPSYLFLVLLLFSAFNLYRSGDSIREA